MIREAIEDLVAGNSLSAEQAAQAMNEIMDGDATPAQFGAFVTALHLKGETPEEIAGMARVMREKSLHVQVGGPLVDTCGTGGDASGSFNISTTAGFVVAGAGVKVAKHGNRAMSGACGSADVLEDLGVKIDLSPEGVQRCLEEVGFGFMFAQRYHPSMRFAAGSVEESARILTGVLDGQPGPARDVVVINAAAALVAADHVTTLEAGVAAAAESIDSGRARKKLYALIDLTNRLE